LSFSFWAIERVDEILRILMSFTIAINRNTHCASLIRESESELFGERKNQTKHCNYSCIMEVWWMPRKPIRSRCCL
jgi:hypothetical protein